MTSSDDSTMEPRYAAAYEAMAAFEDAPFEEDQLLSGYPLEKQFRIDLVLWTVERLRRMGRSVDAAWLMHELLFFCAHCESSDRDLDAFIEGVIFEQLYMSTRDELEHNRRAWDEFNRITDTVLALVESVQ